MTLAIFLFQSNFCLLVFYSFYRVFLHKETFFVWNRIYLMAALCFSFAMPILRFEWLTTSSVSKEVQLRLLDVIVEGRAAAGTDSDWMQWGYGLYFLGAMVSMMFFLYKLWSLKSKLKHPQKGHAFSFFSFKRIDPNLPDFETINRHEEVHVQQFHSIDILLLELAGVVFWFNPVIYLFKSSLKNIHEYLADEAAAEFKGSKKKYAMHLLSTAMGLSPDLTNSFVRQSEVKKRILMLQRERSARRSLWKYLCLLPLLSILLLFSSAIKATDHKSGTVEWKAEESHGAEFPGGLTKFAAYLKIATRYPKAGTQKGLEGRVMVSFIVDVDGAVTDVAIKSGVDPVLDQEAIRVISHSPKWIPGKENGQPVRVQYDIGVNFKSSTNR